MIPHVEDCYFYTRRNNILIACLTDGTEVPLVKFKSKFIDLVAVQPQPLQYMKDYMQYYPELWEYIEQENKIGEQIQLGL